MINDLVVVTTLITDIDFDCSIEELVRRGRFRHIAHNFFSGPFPATPPPHRTPVDLHVMRFSPRLDARLATSSVAEALTQKGYRPADLRELLTLAAAATCPRCSFNIVGLGTEWVNDQGIRHVAGLSSANARMLRLLHIQFEPFWYWKTMFVGVPL
ncbi:MAG TPA: hypothetical protein VEA69_02950 [Tepidisphaeraceae bacterium]|nr:hypothetical protein [Tepidisphaeraceae bacterium]